MSDHPIIFSAPMIRALLDGRKTMTRRLAWRFSDVNDNHTKEPSPWQRVKPGDRLYVRENFSGPHEWETIPPSGWGWDTMMRPPIWYWADGNPADGDWTKPRPSIHMPRWATRLTLVVTATKIKRLQAISERDAQGEGIAAHPRGGWESFATCPDGSPHPFAAVPSKTARISFMELWQSIHGHDSWNANPEVVALTFATHKVNIDAMKEAA